MQHHAILCVGDVSTVLSSLPEEFQSPSADVRHILIEQLNIADARLLAHEASLRPLERPERVFVVSFKNATMEAQNALLKTLEEPAVTTRFYILVPHEEVLIATVRSRLMRDGGAAEEKGVNVVAQEFIASPYRDRLSMIEKKVKEKDTAWVRTLLNGLEVHADQQKDRGLMKELLMVRSYVDRRGSSQKMLLEHMALSLD